MSNRIDDMDELRVALTEMALSIARELDVTLDFSDKSIKKVEKVLGIIHKEYVRTNDDDGLRGVALEFAAYIITVIESTSPGGKWERDHPEFGEEVFPYYWHGKTLFPYSWCLKRIIDGKQDDVWAKYSALVLPSLE